MRSFRFLLVLPALLLFGCDCLAQDASKVIDQFVKAAGGRKALTRIQNLTLDGTTRGSADQQPGTYTFIVKIPNRYYTEWRSGGKTMIEAYNGKSAWHQSEGGDLATFLGPEAVQIEAASQYYNARFLTLSKKKIAATLKGSATIAGRAATQVELTFPTGATWEVYFDQQTHLIDAEKATIAGIPREVYYDNYRVVLYEEIDANQKQIDKIKENYAGTQVEEETEYDKNGKVTKKEVHEYTFFYLNGDEITTLVKKDGKALSDEEQKKENDKTKKRIEEAQKEEKKKEEKEAKAKEQGKDPKDPDEPGVEMFLRVSQFVNPRRERFRGQDTLVFDFEPNPEYKPKNMAEKIVKQLAGVIWVDEKAKDVVRLEAYFVGDVHIRLHDAFVPDGCAGRSSTWRT